MAIFTAPDDEALLPEAKAMVAESANSTNTAAKSFFIQILLTQILFDNDKRR
jgi:hypothetical protein